MTYTVKINGTDYSDKTVSSISVYWGREDIYRQPDPAVATFSLVRDSSIATIDPTTFNINDTVSIYATANGTKYRFYGDITDIQVNWYTIDVTAVSPASRWPSEVYYVTLAPAFDPGPVWDSIQRPTGQALDNWVSGFSGGITTDMDPGELKVGWWYEQPDIVNYWELAQSIVAGEPFGVLVDDLTLGSPNWWQARFTDATKRRNTTPDLTLTSDEILLDWTVRKSGSDKVNTLTTSVPAHPDGWWPEEEINWDQPADTTTQRYSGALQPTFSPPEAVRNLATSMIGLWRTPNYQLRRITIPMGTLSAVRQGAILNAIRMSNLVSIPAILPGFATEYFIEGCQDQYVYGNWTLTLFLSDATLTHPPDRWDDVAPSLEWGQVSASLTWSDAYMERF